MEGAIPDITLPPGCDTITVWLRLEGQVDRDIEVGMDWLKFEDLTCLEEFAAHQNPLSQDPKGQEAINSLP
jgi:hypothetical protein